VPLASHGLTDDQFLAAFHSCRLPKEQFHNLDHFRLAWLHLHRESQLEAEIHVCQGIIAFAAHLGATQKYHETITVAWLRLLATHPEPTFEEFIRKNEAKLSLDTLHRFWSAEILASQRARREWVPPDLQELPHA
jgi:hypothetical protein